MLFHKRYRVRANLCSLMPTFALILRYPPSGYSRSLVFPWRKQVNLMSERLVLCSFGFPSFGFDF
uniref:Uncharacterized protein n=1 Tax=Enterococcus faecalis TaxID=1351 RepID=Q8VT28_ENTFL|nr:unknown [Enterococcus faecalis]